MFIPTPRFLTQWHAKNNMLLEISWFTTWGGARPKTGPIHRHKCASEFKFDPTNQDPNSLDFQHWLTYADFYQWPHIIYFDSWEELANKINTVDLDEVSEKMRLENLKIKHSLQDQYMAIFNKMFKGAKGKSKIPSDNFNEAMKKLWDVDLSLAKTACDDPVTEPEMICK